MYIELKLNFKDLKPFRKSLLAPQSLKNLKKSRSKIIDRNLNLAILCLVLRSLTSPYTHFLSIIFKPGGFDS